MGQEQTTLNLINLIYDAAIDPKLWSIFLGRFTAAIGGTQAAIMVVDQERPSRNVGVTFGVNPEAQRVYGEHFWKMDEWSKRGQLLPVLDWSAMAGCYAPRKSCFGPNFIMTIFESSISVMKYSGSLSKRGHRQRWLRFCVPEGRKRSMVLRSKSSSI